MEGTIIEPHLQSFSLEQVAASLAGKEDKLPCSGLILMVVTDGLWLYDSSKVPSMGQ